MKEYRKSKTTRPVAFRIDNESYGIVNRRAEKQGLKISSYLKKFVTNDARRKR